VVHNQEKATVIYTADFTFVVTDVYSLTFISLNLLGISDDLQDAELLASLQEMKI
jgi:hypothetical protein